MNCPSCGAPNPAGQKFCGDCGSRLAAVCPSCGTSNPGGQRFCGECGAPLAANASAPAVATPVVIPEAPTAERRLVSILFTDLVGFTTLSEERDPEEVRELLSKYFDTSRQLIGRYGGTVEKFIGDAVMAVWGTPIAQEDDAERAVRAALDLMDAVSALGAETGAAELRARAGVHTGEAAVTIGAEGQGMVAGDLVNTASRIQGAAAPGAVFVGDATRRSTEVAIAYEDAGSHELKGKAEPVPLWRAVRVVGGIGGSLRGTGLEAPFVGRGREMRLLKELFHAGADERRAALISVVGIAGVGKTRLSQEFEKYSDGLAGDIWWHRGRCLAYGEGVAYWALAEMVRMRARIAEGEDAASAQAKLQQTLAEFVGDPEERRWVEPRLAHLLGLEEHSTRDPAELFSAWRVFFERIADQGPAVMVFEDLQWADAALLDFIEYLLDWSRDHPLYIVTLSRPELTDRRPTWGAGKRNFTSLFLEPLSPEAMEELMRGLVPGLPEELRSRILDRAEGVPLYAVETVRMLLDRGLLEKQDGEFHPTGAVLDLEVPETLHALIAARLDGLSTEERRILQTASVLGKTFTKQGLAAVTSLPESELDGTLTSLARKEIFSIEQDPRSPERGQYGFLQDLIKKVAYDTLSKRERKALHLAAARYLEGSGYEEEEIVEVLADHYFKAYESAPDAPDAADIMDRAREKLAGAGERAASLAANEEAERYFVQAAELTDEPVEKAGLIERAGQMAFVGNRLEAATDSFERAIALFEEAGHTHPAARVSARLAEIMWNKGHIDEAVERMERSFEVLSEDEPDADLAWFTAQLGRLHYFFGQPEQAGKRLEQALDMAEGLWLPEVLSQALNSKGALVLLGSKGRPEEGFALLRHALHLALEHDIPSAAQRAYYNLSNLLYYHDRYEACLPYIQEGLALARKLGHRHWESIYGAEMIFVLFMTGAWDEAVERAQEVPYRQDFTGMRFALVEFLQAIPHLYVLRGDIEEAREILVPFGVFADSPDLQERASYAATLAMVLRAEGKLDDALARAEEALEARRKLGPIYPGVKMALAEGVEAALALGDLAKAQELLSMVLELRAGDQTPFQRAQAARLGARLTIARGEVDGIEQGFKSATGLYREIGTPFWLGATLLEHGEWLVGQGRADAAGPLLAEARDIFERLKAKPWLHRLAGLSREREVAPA